ncbi:MAG: nicotinate phosphoribosyltransferase [Candidatus Hydrogenedentes bacterium]|nr:nicotinate phosphoribosyltransferase [Candidatus Hydrogenedentota bacterium]
MSTCNDCWHKREGLALLTDFYELTMMAGHLKDGRMEQQVSFDYFFRSLPPHTGFAVAAGLDSFLRYLEHLRFTESDLVYLKSLNVFDDTFLDYLAKFKSRCSVRAVPEGTFVFPGEPVIQVEGPILDAQLIETALLNMVNHQTLIATKAARVCLAAEDDPVLEFGLRRAHGPDGGLSASRACYIGGCTSTSNVLAGKVYHMPVAGTHAHSWVMSFSTELEAFRAFARIYPERCVLLVDTYDPVKSGIPNAIQVFCEMRDRGIDIRPAVRLDSGDLAKLSKICHSMMSDAGFEDPLIVASNDLNEDLIADLKRQGACINAWGVGTHLITAYDAPALSGVYKLVAIETEKGWQPRMKVSSNLEKATDPGRKQLVRYYDAAGQPLGDVLYLEEEQWPESGVIPGRSRKNPHAVRRLKNAASAQLLLEPVFEKGKRVQSPKTLESIRKTMLEQRDCFPEEYKRLRNPEIFRVLLSTQLGEMKDAMLMNPESAQ